MCIGLHARYPLLFQTVMKLNFLDIQCIHKRMVRFQKLTRNLFLTLHGHNENRQQRQLSKFLMCYQQFVSHAYCGAARPVSMMASEQEKAFCVLRFLRCLDLWLQCSVSFVHGLELLVALQTKPVYFMSRDNRYILWNTRVRQLYVHVEL
jgi:hypothetical protein